MFSWTETNASFPTNALWDYTLSVLAICHTPTSLSLLFSPFSLSLLLASTQTSSLTNQPAVTTEQVIVWLLQYDTIWMPAGKM